MNVAQKQAVAQFLDKSASYLGGAYAEIVRYEFKDDVIPPWQSEHKKDASAEFQKTAALPTTANDLKKIAGLVAECTLCALHRTRLNTVPGEGVPHPLVMIIGEAPGADEDKSGRPFVGAAGALLDKMLESIALSRKTNCFIANIVKCRPPENRDPASNETSSCFGFLQKQVDLLKPTLILSLGNVSAKTLLKTETGISRLRGNWEEFCGIPLMPTFHPSYLLRDASQKAAAWDDLKMLCARLAKIDGVYAAQTEELRRARKIV
ncbi:MAG: uracil-DNA glycosylase [Termitinemataceae bacterium]|nr:MAG: uracil-DNA glycosylase [Termitinemataceae bacterium]